MNECFPTNVWLAEDIKEVKIHGDFVQDLHTSLENIVSHDYRISQNMNFNIFRCKDCGFYFNVAPKSNVARLFLWGYDDPYKFLSFETAGYFKAGYFRKCIPIKCKYNDDDRVVRDIIT